MSRRASAVATLLSSLLVAAAVLAGAPAAAQAAAPVEITLKVTPQTGSVDDDFVATLTITISGVNGAERVWEPDWGDFVVQDRRSQQSTQWSYDPQRGQEIRSVDVRRYLIKARRAGKLRIGEAKVKVDGKEHATRPFFVNVAPSGQAPNPTGPQLPDPIAPLDPSQPRPTDPTQHPPPDPSIVGPTFVHVFADRTKVKVGEQVTVTWLLYTRSEVLKYEPPKQMRFDDFWVEPVYDPPNGYFEYTQEVVGGRTYNVAILTRKALFPTRAGKVVVPAFRAELATMATPFGSPLKLASKELALEVEALPPGAPPGFDPGLVGQWKIDAAIDRDNVPAGESLELILTVRGEGAIRRSKVPRLSVAGFEVYPPRDFVEKVELQGDRVRGERRYSYVLQPLQGGTLPIGPIELPTFNPQTGRYDVARADLLQVKVVGDPGKLAGAGGGPGNDNVISRDIRPPRELAAVSPRLLAGFEKSPWFLLALLAPGVAFLGVLLVDVLRERLRRETPRARLRRARGRARKRQKLADVHLRGNRPGKFYGEISAMISEHVEERVGEPVGALTRPALKALLEQRGFPAEIIQRIVDELEQCDFARFAPSTAGPGEMKAALRRAQELLRAIEKVRPLGGEGEGQEVAA